MMRSHPLAKGSQTLGLASIRTLLAVRASSLALLLFALGASAQAGHTFAVRSYEGKCLDFGAPPQVAGSPVFLYGCNGTISQQVRVVEPDASPGGHHTVVLFAGSKVIGVRGNGAATGDVLELQDPNLSSNQRFQLDGDSILLAANRNLAVQIQNNRGANRTPLVLASRELKDAEFWTLHSIETPPAQPTSGFVHVPQDKQLADALQNATFGAVIVLDQGFDQSIESGFPLKLNEGVTLRGDRRGTNVGPRLKIVSPAATAQGGDNVALIDIAGNETRITGVRLLGPSIDESTQPSWTGVLTHDRYTTFVDHNEFSGWTAAGVGGDDTGGTAHPSPLVRPTPVQIVRNFIHHNEENQLGYGVVSGSGSFPLIRENTFLMNRHAVADDGTDFSGYRALNNLVQSPVPGYQKSVEVAREQDFDMHGLGSTCGQHCGGSAGEYVEIGHNTFLGTALHLSTHYSFFLRGTPSYLVEFHDNVVRQNQGDAIENKGPAAKLILSNNRFGIADPTDSLAVGDFDGDGKDDLFLATGAAWYYAPAGAAEWRFLNAQTDSKDALLFGDFDGDGRTDVFTQRGRDWLVSWGGASPWEKINTADAALKDLAVGDFDGDGRADIFYSDGKSWYVSSGGSGPLTLFQTSSLRVADLRFGDFNHDGKTDVLGIVAGAWRVSYGAKGSWTLLRARLSDSVADLVIGDFDGDGRSDVAVVQNVLGVKSLRVSSGGTSDWTTYCTFNESIAAFGQFNSRGHTDLLVWNGDHLDIRPGGKGSPVRQSSEQMR